MKVRLIYRNYIESDRSEIITEVTILMSFWLWSRTKVYRKVYGEYFLYNDGKYTALSKTMERNVSKWFKLPEDPVYKK